MELPGHVVALGGKDFLEKGVATHSSILAWRSPWTGEPGGLQSMGSQGVGHDWAADLPLSWPLQLQFSEGPGCHCRVSAAAHASQQHSQTLVSGVCADGCSDLCEAPRVAVLVPLSLMASDAEHLFTCLWPSVCLLWRNVCSGLLPIF